MKKMIISFTLKDIDIFYVATAWCRNTALPPQQLLLLLPQQHGENEILEPAFGRLSSPATTQSGKLSPFRFYLFT
jgi:hypothetical protein